MQLIFHLGFVSVSLPGTVCDDDFEEVDAEVVCRQLGYSGAAVLPEYGGGKGRIWLDDVACESNPAAKRLIECSHARWGENDCNHDEDVGVRCFYAADGNMQLVDGDGELSGRVEIYFDGKWGT